GGRALGGGAGRDADDRPLRRPLARRRGRAGRGGGRHARTPLLRSGHGSRHLPRQQRSRCMKPRQTVIVLLLLALPLALVAAGCGGSSKKSSGGSTNAAANVSGKVTITGVWTGDEQKSFQAV